VVDVLNAILGYYVLKACPEPVEGKPVEGKQNLFSASLIRTYVIKYASSDI
jgi:hypothetical protein